eukprot:1956122-Rhodomonas_salina.1
MELRTTAEREFAGGRAMQHNPYPPNPHPPQQGGPDGFQYALQAAQAAAAVCLHFCLQCSDVPRRC